MIYPHKNGRALPRCLGSSHAADAPPHCLLLTSLQDEDYAPLTDMPIKKLQFTPFKPPAGAAAAPSANKQPAAPGTIAYTHDSVGIAGLADVLYAVPEATAASGVTPIQVFLRLKPLPEDTEHAITKLDHETVAMHTTATASTYGDGSAPHIELTEQDKYHFSHVFGPETLQEELYSNTTEPLVEQLFTGQDGLVFAYGPTNSGKTFTIQGGKEENAGILPRVLNRIFQHVENKKAAGEQWTVWVNFMEIYNESIYDLLEDRATQTSESRPRCELKENNGRIIVKGLKQMQVRDAHEAVTVSRFGAKFRQTAETGSNDNSSRSHSVFNIKLFRGEAADVKDENQVFAKLSVVDLAGSERARKTKATGERLKEASNINVSLMNLGRCLEAIKWNQVAPPPTAVVSPPPAPPFRHPPPSIAPPPPQFSPSCHHHHLLLTTRVTFPCPLFLSWSFPRLTLPPPPPLRSIHRITLERWRMLCRSGTVISPASSRTTLSTPQRCA